MKGVQDAEKGSSITIGFGEKVILWRVMSIILATQNGFAKLATMNYRKMPRTEFRKTDGEDDDAESKIPTVL